jgi:hypothetical protein
MFSILYRILDVVIGTLVLVITFMMGMLMNIYQSQRLVEFGLLQAIGYTKKQLFARVFAETAIVIRSIDETLTPPRSYTSCGNCVGAPISRPSPVGRAVQFCGSSVRCGMNGAS